MMEIKSSAHYYRYFIIANVIFLLGGTLIQTIKGVPGMAVVTVFIVLEIALLFAKFTKVLSIDASSLTIGYYFFLSIKQLKIPVNEIQVKLKQHRPNRGNPYTFLYILKNGIKVYKVDSRDGFEEEDLARLSGLLQKDSHHI